MLDRAAATERCGPGSLRGAAELQSRRLSAARTRCTAVARAAARRDHRRRRLFHRRQPGHRHPLRRQASVNPLLLNDEECRRDPDIVAWPRRSARTICLFRRCRRLRAARFFRDRHQTCCRTYPQAGLFFGDAVLVDGQSGRSLGARPPVRPRLSSGFIDAPR